MLFPPSRTSYCLFALSLALLQIFPLKAQELALARNGTTDYQIVVAAEASETLRRAGSELRDFLKQISRADFPLATDTAPIQTAEILIGQNRHLQALNLPLTTANLGTDGFLIKTSGPHLIILGATDRGTLNSVYTFLEDYLGCRWFSSSVSRIPRVDTLRLGPIDDRQVPPFAYREVYYYDAMDPLFAARNKLNGNASVARDGRLAREHHAGWGSWCHTFGGHVPPDKFFDSHPEYFALVDGKRRRDTQLCLTHPDVLALVIADLRERMSRQPETHYWSVSQNDTGGNCQCENCAAIDAREGSPMGSLLQFVNQVAAAFPDKTISTLSYQYSRRPPKNLRPATNVLIMLCSIECDRRKPIAAEPTSASFRQDVEGWSQICQNVFVWDYVVQFSNLVSPFPNLRTLQPDVRFFAQNHAKGMFSQGNREHAGEFAELRAFLLAKLLWNPDCNVDRAMNEFLAGYYSAASRPIRQYLDQLHDSMLQGGAPLQIFGGPADQRQACLSPDRLRQYQALFDDAERLTASEPDALLRVQTARMPLWYAQLELGYGTLSERKEAARRLFATADRVGLRMFNEWDLPTEKYRQRIRERLDKESNLALSRPAQCFSSYEADGWSLARLTDGNTDALGWSSKAFSTCPDHSLYPEYVLIDLGTNCRIRQVSLFPRADGTNIGRGFPQDFAILVAHQGQPWRKVSSLRNYPAPTDSGARNFELTDADGRYLKIEATRLREAEPGAYRFQLAELAVYGEPAAAPTSPSVAPPPLRPASAQRLRCENRDNPVGVDDPQPRLSWWMDSSTRGAHQSAFQVLVASNPAALDRDQGDLWDSGKVPGDQSIAVRYAGTPLRSLQSCCWKIRLWDEKDQPTPWSRPANFTMGMLHPQDWHGKWVGADQVVPPDAAGSLGEGGAAIHTTSNPGVRPVYLRREFNVAKPVTRAILSFSGLGFSELFIDGTKVGDYVVGPGFTTYNKRVPYLVFDVTDRFAQPGPKALGVILADGWYGNGYGHGFEKNVYVDHPKLLLDLRLEHPDGTETVIVSDAAWKWAHGEITRSTIVREDLDLRQARDGWNRIGHDENGWRPVTLVKAPEGILVRQKEAPSKIVEQIRPVSLAYNATHKTAVFDFGREFNGWVRLRTSGPAGTTLSITTVPSVALPRTSYFTLAGRGAAETYEPRFAYVGLRQVIVTNLLNQPSLDDLTGCLVSMSWAPAGSFRCSDDVVNWLYDATRRTVVAYTTWLPNDPVREWKAWMQDPQNMFWSTAYLFDAQNMYERWEWDIIDGQRPDGSSPNVTPGAYFDAYNSPWWGGCIVWVPWHWYQFYGDPSLLASAYPAMKRYVDFLTRPASISGEYAGRITTEGLQDWGLADWCPVEETPRPIVNTPACYLYATILSQTAALLNLPDEAHHYTQLAQTILDAFNREFLDPATGIYGVADRSPQNGFPISPLEGRIPHHVWWTGNRPCTQAGQALPLALGMVPEPHRPAARAALLSEIAAHTNRVSTGFVSTPYLLALLAEEAPEIGWALTSSREYPSWYGMTVGSDQDLLKETWAGGQALMPSLGGNIAGWHHQALGGIRPDPAQPGFKKFRVKPALVGDLHWVESSYDSVYGRIVSHWRRTGNHVVLDIVIPPNTTATVYVPTAHPDQVTESGNPASQAQGVTPLESSERAAVFSVTGGTYHFESDVASSPSN